MRDSKREEIEAIDPAFAQRMTDALIYHQGQLRRRVKQEEVGEEVGWRLKGKPFPSATTSRHFTGKRELDRQTVLVYAEVMGVDPGWLAFGEKSAAPAPPVTAAQLAQPVPPRTAPKRRHKRA